jgi:transcriptional regulator with XRE-family HTH domain
MEPIIAFGRALRQLRKEAKLTQEQLALEAEVQRKYVSLLELGQNQPTVTVIFKLASALKCAPSNLIRLTEEILSANDKD